MSYDSTLKNFNGDQINPRTRAGCVYLDENTTVEDKLKELENSSSITVDSELSEESENPVQNKVIAAKLTELGNELENSSSITVDSELSEESGNPVQNKVIAAKLNELENNSGSKVFMGYTAPSDLADLADWSNPVADGNVPYCTYTASGKGFTAAISETRSGAHPLFITILFPLTKGCLGATVQVSADMAVSSAYATPKATPLYMSSDGESKYAFGYDGMDLPIELTIDDQLNLDQYPYLAITFYASYTLSSYAKVGDTLQVSNVVVSTGGHVRQEQENVIVIEDVLSESSENPVQNKVIAAKLTELGNELENSSSITVDSELSEESGNPVQNKVIAAKLNEVFQSVSDGKTLIASAITDKGVDTASDATFSDMAEHILNIESGGSSGSESLCGLAEYAESFSGINSIYLYYYGADGGSDYAPVSPETIANRLGLNYDADTNIMYMGDNNKNGIQWDVTSSYSYGYIYFVINGERVSNCAAKYNLNNASKLYYKVTDDLILFGVGTAIVSGLQFAIGKGVDLSTGTEKWGYCLSNNSYNSTFLTAPYTIITEDCDAYGTPELLFTADLEIAALMPLCSISHKFKFNKIYAPTIFKTTYSACMFDLCGKSFLTGIAYQGIDGRWVAEI